MLQPSSPLYVPGVWRKQKFNSSMYAFLYLKTGEINLALFLLNLLGFFCFVLVVLFCFLVVVFVSRKGEEKVAAL